jgi:ADP-ribose pyrophosphatase YjhB (NUDIX family)
MRDAYCSACGAAYPTTNGYPRVCGGCGLQVWANPVPVAVVLQPIVDGGRTGLLVVRRAIPPQVGKLGLVGGFIEDDETWAEGAARELREEASVVIDAASLTPYWFTSTAPRPNRVLLFATGERIDRADLPPWTPNPEASARGVVFGPDGLDEVFAFDLHATAARRYFGERGLRGPHDFIEV